MRIDAVGLENVKKALDRLIKRPDINQEKPADYDTIKANLEKKTQELNDLTNY